MKKNIVDAYHDFISYPFPVGSLDDVVSSVHNELAEYEAYLAGYISRFGKGEEEVKDKIIYDTSYEERLMQRLKEKPELKEDVQRLMDNLNKLKKLVELVQSS